MSESGRRWRFVLAAVVLGALALGLPTWRAWRHYAKLHPVLAIEVPPGAVGEYDGARWRLLAIEVETAPADPFGWLLELPADTVVLRAHFTFTPGPETDLEALRLCGGRVRDAAGRVWNANPMALFRIARKLPDNCGRSLGDPQDWTDVSERTARVGEPWAFEHAYVIPEAVADQAEPELLLAERYPYYLRFKR